MNKKIMFLIGILLISNVYALGVTPARTTMDFAPNLEKNVSFSILNSEGRDVNLILLVTYSDSGLNQSITLSANTVKIKSTEGSKQITYNVKLPADLKPGLHTANIVVLSMPNDGGDEGAVVGAAIGVVTELNINVPYPGKFAESDLNVIDPEAGKDAVFVMPVLSKGNLDLTNVYAHIEIYNKLGEKVASFNTASIEVKSGERKELISNWKANVPAGNYLAKVTLIADEQTINLEREFSVGQSTLEISQIQVNNFKLGQIAKFEMIVENKWSETMKDVYIQTQIFDKDGKAMADFSSAHYDIEPLSKKVLNSYWDSAGAKTGTYDSTLYLKYGDKSTQKNVKLKITQNNIEVVGFGFVISEKKIASNSSQLVTILIVVIALLVIVNLSWFIFLRKRLIKKK